MYELCWHASEDACCRVNRDNDRGVSKCSVLSRVNISCNDAPKKRYPTGLPIWCYYFKSLYGPPANGVQVQYLVRPEGLSIFTLRC